MVNADHEMLNRPSSRHNSMRSARSQSRDARENGQADGGGVIHTINEHANEYTSLLSQPIKTGAEDERPYVKWPAYFVLKTWQTLTSNPVNVLLVFVPLGIVSGAVGWSPIATFILNFLAIIPLASLLSFATEELSAKLGQTLGGLLNATFGNAVELIVRSSDLTKGMNADGTCRLASSLLEMAKSALSNPVCSVPSFPTFSSSSAAASSLEASVIRSKALMEQWLRQCPPLWQSRPHR